uniref:Uncharacterized protein n=1 Tax=Enterococcus phage PMBT56 TaxID=3229530 RepID=A0AB39C6L4_9CAUD
MLTDWLGISARPWKVANSPPQLVSPLCNSR